MKNDKKRFELPEAILIKFCDEEIIVTSSDGDWGDDYGDDSQDEFED